MREIQGARYTIHKGIIRIHYGLILHVLIWCKEWQLSLLSQCILFNCSVFRPALRCLQHLKLVKLLFSVVQPFLLILRQKPVSQKILFVRKVVTRAGAEGQNSNILTQYLSCVAWDWAEILKIDFTLTHPICRRYEICRTNFTST